MRQFGIALLVAAVSLALMASSAQANYVDRDPDDTDRPGLDIEAVHSTLTLHHGIAFKTRFIEILKWTQGASVRVYIDSRGGPDTDFFLVAYRFSGRLRCELLPPGGPSVLIGLRRSPDMVLCQVKRRELKATRKIRWKVGSFRGRTMPVEDWAPGPTEKSWYPHA